ncbi:MAG: hypothetical protein HY858_09935 [Candidatus Solibacter usitatus]|nr:hypothetical protein [Candidatus Solibacter usitatus]
MGTTFDLEGFRERLKIAFPPQPFHRVVSTHDECDQGIELRRELPGKRWDELRGDLLDNSSLSICLLQPAAMTAFLPAWLLRSMEIVARDNLTLEFTLYFLCPGDEEEGWQTERAVELVESFDSAQRAVVAEFLRAILERPNLRQLHRHAAQGLKWWSV